MTKKTTSVYGKRISKSQLARIVRSSERLQASNPGLRVYLELSPVACPGPGLSIHAIYNGRGVYFNAINFAEEKGKNVMAEKLQKAVASVLAGGGNVL